MKNPIIKNQSKTSQNMTQKNEIEAVCSVCESGEDLRVVAVSEEPLNEESYIAEQLVRLCDDHFMELSEETEYHVRELPPVPDSVGGFTRNEDEDGTEILYDDKDCPESWIRFNPKEDEIDLSKGEL